jgi:hypothetical protein
LRRIVIQDCNSHKTPQRDIVLRNGWPVSRQVAGMPVLAPPIQLPVFIFGCTLFSINGPSPCALFSSAAVLSRNSRAFWL